VLFLFMNYPSTTEFSSLSLHDALPIYPQLVDVDDRLGRRRHRAEAVGQFGGKIRQILERLAPGDAAVALHPLALALDPALGQERSEEHTSELQSRGHLVCRLLLEKKKQ